MDETVGFFASRSLGGTRLKRGTRSAERGIPSEGRDTSEVAEGNSGGRKWASLEAGKGEAVCPGRARVPVWIAAGKFDPDAA
jgi:hypothetical protein